MPSRVASVLSAALLALLLIGCGGGSGLDVAEGRYRLYVEGSLTDTLTGPALVRTYRNGHVGIELGPRDGPGLSMELKPPPQPDRRANGSAPSVPPRRYDVVAASLLDGAPADSLSGLMAFLSLADFQFTATQGHFSVTQAGGGTVGGRLDVEMTDRGDAAPGERTVRVTGVLWATAP
jgi:hypothetical protein